MDEEVKIRQSVEGEILRRVSELNRKYEANDFNGVRDGERNYKIIPGRIPVLISAPHTVRHWRNGEMKERDGMTGGIAEYLCERFSTWGVIRTWNANDDPNYNGDEPSETYRQAVAEVVQEQGIGWVFDLHGCRDTHGFEMDVGVNGGENLDCTVGEILKLVQVWRDLGVDARVDERFRAHGAQTVSNATHRAAGVNCLQVEVSGQIRTTNEGLEKFCAGWEQILEKVKNTPCMG